MLSAAKHLFFHPPHRHATSASETRPETSFRTRATTASATALASALSTAPMTAPQSRVTTAAETAPTTRPDSAFSIAPETRAASAPDSALTTRAQDSPTSDLGSHSPLQVRNANSSAVLHNHQSLTPFRPRLSGLMTPVACEVLHNVRLQTTETNGSRRTDGQIVVRELLNQGLQVGSIVVEAVGFDDGLTGIHGRRE